MKKKKEKEKGRKRTRWADARTLVTNKLPLVAALQFQHSGKLLHLQTRNPLEKWDIGKLYLDNFGMIFNWHT